ncbi:hypothetical protein, partial [Frankia sp. CIT1]|uniref:hypothetical protein n=1 Tax=Frankia sp. CIT1 TaxID=2880974 RepID=UPI001EF3DD29
MRDLWGAGETPAAYPWTLAVSLKTRMGNNPVLGVTMKLWSPATMTVRHPVIQEVFLWQTRDNPRFAWARVDLPSQGRSGR